MALNAQLAGTFAHGDFPFFNYGTTDIPANMAVKVDGANTVGAGQQGVGVVLTTATTDNGIGFTVERIPAGKAGRVRCKGIAVGIADGSLAAGIHVMPSATSGKNGYVAAQTAGKPSLGVTLSVAVDSDQVLILLAPGKNA